MAEHSAFSLTTLFAFVAVEAVVFGTLGLDLIPALGSGPAVG